MPVITPGKYVPGNVWYYRDTTNSRWLVLDQIVQVKDRCLLYKWKIDERSMKIDVITFIFSLSIEMLPSSFICFVFQWGINVNFNLTHKSAMQTSLTQYSRTKELSFPGNRSRFVQSAELKWIFLSTSLLQCLDSVSLHAFCSRAAEPS